MRDDLSRYPFLFSREDRSDKISYPQPKKDKNGEKKDFMEIAKEQEYLKKMTLLDEKYMENHYPRMNYDKLIFDFVEKTGIEKVFISRKAALTLYSCGKTSGVVFKSGGFETQVTPVEEGFVRQEGCVEGLMGGNSLTKAIAREMSNLNIYSSENQSWDDWMTLQQAEACKKAILKLEDEVGQEESMLEEFTLPDGSLFYLSEDVKALNNYPFSAIRQGVSLIQINFLG